MHAFIVNPPFLSQGAEVTSSRLKCSTYTHEPNRTEQVNDISFPTTHAGSPVVSRGDGPGVPGGPSSLAKPHPTAAGICCL